MLLIQDTREYCWRTRQDYWFKVPITGYLVEAKYYRLQRDGKLFVKSGYAWNGTSGGVKDSDRNLGASLLHDVFYQMFREKQLPLHLRDETDQLFEQHCVELGTRKRRAAFFEWVLRKFGRRAATQRQSAIAPERRIPVPRSTRF